MPSLVKVDFGYGENFKISSMYFGYFVVIVLTKKGLVLEKNIFKFR